jgi:hypothetical protein
MQICAVYTIYHAAYDKPVTKLPNALQYISKMYFGHWQPPGVSERMWSVNLNASISGEY